MGSATQLTDFSDLYTDLMNRTREETSKAATIALAKRYINIALHDMHIGFSESFSWAERRAVLVTHDNYTTGTVAITKGDTALVGTDTLWDTDNGFGVNNMQAGGKLTIGGGEEVYEIASVTDDTNAVLASKFIDTTVTAASYEYFEDEYALAADFARPVDLQTFADDGEIRLIDRTAFRRNYARNKVVGRPRIAALLELPAVDDTVPTYKIRLHPPPDDYYQIPYTYITTFLATSTGGTAQTQLVEDGDVPIVPLRYRHAIVFHALYHWYRDRKDDSRSQEAKAEYTDLMLRVAGDSAIGDRRLKLAPRPGLYTYRAQRPWHGSSGRFDLNGRFDRMEDRW